MGDGDTKSQPAVGFLTVRDLDGQGLVGGYLILNIAGRPLEFHCTAPLKANRAQQILFGPTLEPYLYGEQIGQSLLNKATVETLVVCTDLEPVLSARQYANQPVCLIMKPIAGSASEGGEPKSWRVDGPHAAPAHLAAFQLGRNRLAVTAERREDQQQVLERLAALESFDLAEPFDRIREAVEEAQKAGR